MKSRNILLATVLLAIFLFPADGTAARRKTGGTGKKELSDARNARRSGLFMLDEDPTPAQSAEKIAAIRKRIAENPEITPRDRQSLLEGFDDVAQTPMGRWILEHADPDLNFAVKSLGQGYSGVYGTGSKTITLSRKIFDRISEAKTPGGRLDKLLWLAHVIAHESTHSVQRVNRMNYPPGISFPEKVTMNKVFELHSLLNENIVRFQVGNLPKYGELLRSGQIKPVPMHIFYRDLREAKLAEGVSEAEADRFARTKFVETFWMNCGKKPIEVGGKTIMPPAGVMLNWNTTYSLVPFRRRCLEKNAKVRHSMQPRGIAAELKRFTDAMKIDLPPSFFTDPEKAAFRLVSTRRLIGYEDGVRRTEMDALAVGCIIKVYRGNALWKVVIETRNAKAASLPSHTETFEGTEIRRAEYFCRGGKMNGIYREFDRTGKQIMELPVKDNFAAGMGWTLDDDGKRIPMRFSGGFAVRPPPAKPAREH